MLPNIGERVEISSRQVPPSDKLLDVGCGDGVLFNFVKEKVNKFYGVDNDRSMLSRAKKLGIVTKFADLDKEKIPFQNNFFDTVTTLDVIEHVKDPKAFLTEINRVLKKGGILIITTPNIRFSPHISKLITSGQFPKTSEDPSLYDGGHIHFFTFKDIENLLLLTGFKVKSEIGIINKVKRGWKGRLLEKIFGEKLMREFRSPGILIVAQK